MPARDPIAEPSGARTPGGPGETWPARVDTHLAEGSARLGPKDLFGWQANSSPDRLTHPASGACRSLR